VLQAVEDRNEAQKSVIVDKIRRHYGGELAGRTFALWGLSFKPNTDDMREAASRVVMEALWAARAPASRPTTPRRWRRRSGSTATAPTSCSAAPRRPALREADALIIMTEWQVFRAPDFDLIRERLKPSR
jgi:UDPglucose 6-dehydrogenase